MMMMINNWTGVTSVSAVVRHLGFLKSKLIDTLCIIMPNFVEIGRVSVILLPLLVL